MGLRVLFGALACGIFVLAQALPASAVQGLTHDADIAYGVATRQTLDIYRSENVSDGAPLFIFFYGGGWQEGSKDKPDIRRTAEALAATGLIVVVPDYRVYPDVTFPEFVKDAAAAVALVWRRERQSDGSPRPLILAGHSAGAHIAAMLTFDERYLAEAGLPAGSVAGFIGLSGPYDFQPIFLPFDRIFPRDTRSRSMPLPFVDGSEPPALLVTGNADEVVDMRSTTRLAAQIEAKGGSATVLVEPGGDHLEPYFALSEANSPVRKAVIAFIAKHATPAR